MSRELMVDCLDYLDYPAGKRQRKGKRRVDTALFLDRRRSSWDMSELNVCEARKLSCFYAIL